METSDNCGVPQLTVDGNEVQYVSTSAANNSGNYCLTIPSIEGSYSYDLSAVDASGNRTDYQLQTKIDSTPPRAISFSPTAGGIILISAAIGAQFDEEISAGAIDVSGISGTTQRTGSSLNFLHQGMAEDTTYTATARDVKDMCGNAADPTSWTFTTTSAFPAKIDKPNQSGTSSTGGKTWNRNSTEDVCASISNPDAEATATFCAEGLNVPCQVITIPPGTSNTRCATFAIPDGFEGDVNYTVTFVYKGKTVGKQVLKSYDLKAPSLATNPLTDVTTNKDKFLISATASDAGSGIAFLKFGTPSLSYSKPVAAAQVGPYQESFRMGLNTLTAQARDGAGNTVTQQIIVTRSGTIGLDVQTVSNHCGGPAEWKATVDGTAGMTGELIIKAPRKTSRTAFSLSGAPAVIAYRDQEVGNYEFQALYNDPLTGKRILSNATTRSINGCKFDPTFVADSGIFDAPAAGDGPRVDAFSPQASAGAADVYEKPYVVVFANARVTAAVHNETGRLVKTLFDGLQEAGLYTVSWDGKDSAGQYAPSGKLYTVTVRETNAQDASDTRDESATVDIDNVLPAAALDRLEGTGASPRVFAVFGGASDRNMDSYTLYQVAPGDIATALFTGSLAPGERAPPDVVNLGTVDATSWPPGDYGVRLEAKDAAGNVSVSNTLPLVVSNSSGAVVHVTAAIDGQTAVNQGAENQPPDSPDVFFDDVLPSGSDLLGNWEWSTVAYSGNRSHTTSSSSSTITDDRIHYFIHANPGTSLKAGDNLVQYVYLDSQVREILLQYYTDQGNGEHRVYWGENRVQTGGVPGTASLMYAGGLPPANRWVRLRIPAETVGLAGKTVKGISFVSAGGKTLWDKSTKSNSSLDPGGLGFGLPPASTADDSTATTLVYTLNKGESVRVDVVDAQGQTLKTLANGSAGDVTCCTQGSHRLEWDQMVSSNNQAPDGNYAFQIQNPNGPIDTEIYSQDPAFDPSAQNHPAPSVTSATDANGNVFVVDAAAPSRVAKRNANGLFLASVVDLGTSSVSALALDAGGNLFVKDAAGAVTKWAAGRIPFSIKSLNAVIRVPWKRAIVKATVPIIGAATGKSFKDYTVDVAPGWDAVDSSSWTVLAHGLSEVADSFVFPAGQETVYGNLATWETGLTPGEEYPEQDVFHPQGGDLYRGRWTVRLRVRNVFDDVKTVAVPVIVGRIVNNATGGLIRSDDDRLRVSVPALALNEDWSTFALLRSSGAVEGADVPPVPDDFALVSPAYELLPPGVTFRRPCRFEIDVPADHLETSGVSLYRYNYDRLRWEVVPTERVNSSTGAVIVDPNFVAVPERRGFFALMARKGKPNPPIVFDPFSPTGDRFVSFQGISNPRAQVAVFSIDLSTGIVPVQTDATSEGVFVTPPMYLPPGVHHVAAIQAGDGETIAAGLTSDPSSPMTIVISSRPRVAVSSAAFYRAGFTEIKQDNFAAGESVQFQLKAADPDPAKADSAYVRLASSVSDPDGIVLGLTETGVHTGIFRGTAFLADASDPGYFELKATVKGESITAVPEDDPSKTASLYFENRAPPPAPLIASASHPSVIHDTFESGAAGLNDWSTYDRTGGADVSLSTEAATGKGSVRLTQTKPNGNFSVLVTSRPFNIRENPIFAFDVRMKQTVRFNFFLRYKGGWLEFVLNDAGELAKNFPPSFDQLGSYLPDQRGPALNANGQWQHVEINLFNYFRKKFPNAVLAADFQIDQVILGDWNAAELFGVVSGGTPTGSWAEFDNVLITNAGLSDPNPEFSWSRAGTGYATALDGDPAGVPNDFVTTEGNSRRFIGVPSGFHYFHVRARDANGEWSEPNHYRVLVDTVAPSVSEPQPLPNSRSEALVASVRIVDPVGHGLDPDSVKFSVNGQHYGVESKAVAYDGATGRLTVSLGAITPTPPVFVDGQLIAFSIDDASDWAGNHIPQKFEWTWQADFSRFSGGDFSPLSVNGGSDPAWSPDGARVAFVSSRGGQTDVWVMLSTDTAEAGGSARRLTDDAARESAPRWSPNGKWIAFASDASGTSDLYLLNVENGTAAPITSGPDADTHPAWSNDGTKLIFSRARVGLANLYEIAVDPETGAVQPETRVTVDEAGYNYEPEWSADGSRIYYRRSLYADNIFAVNADGTNAVPLTDGKKDFWPSLRPDGKQIAFVTKRNGDLETIWTMDADGKNQKVLLDNGNIWLDSQPAWSPDGSRLAFSSARSGAVNVWVLSLLEVSDYKVAPAVFSAVATTVPFVISAEASYALSAPNATVTITVLSPNLTVVRTLQPPTVEGSGFHSHAWDGRDDTGQLVPDGAYTLRLRVEGAGSADPIVRDAGVAVDNHAPSAGIAPGAVYLSTRTPVSFSASDPSQIQFVQYGVDVSTPLPNLYAAPFTLPRGTHTVAFAAADRAGNMAAPAFHTYLVDDAAPSVSLSTGAPTFVRDGVLYISSRSAVAIDAADAAPADDTVVSGIGKIVYQIDAQQPVTVFSGNAVLASVSASDGARRVSAQAFDKAGNESPIGRLDVVVDTAPPTFAFVFSPPAVSNGVRLFVTPLTDVSYAAGDAGAGVRGVRRSLDGAGFAAAASSGTFRISQEGPHTLEGYSEDNVDNIGPLDRRDVTVAEEIPSTILAIGDPKSLPYISPATEFVLTAQSGAQIHHVEADIDGAGFAAVQAGVPFTLSQAGAHTLAFRAVKNDLTPEAADSVSVFTDTAAPVTKIAVATPTVPSGAIVRLSLFNTIALTVSDDRAGVRSTFFSVNGATRAYAGPFTLSFLGFFSEGNYLLKAWSVDNVGNAETPSSLLLDVDASKPVSTLSISGPRHAANGKVYVSSSTLFALSAQDFGAPASGVDRIDYSTGTGTLVFVSTLSFVHSGPFALRYGAVDRVGNKENERVSNFVGDITPPQARIDILGEGFIENGTAYLKTDSQLVIAAPDDLSGLSAVQRAIDGGAFVDSGAPFLLPAPGFHTVAARAVDNVLNEKILSLSAYGEDDPPSTTIGFAGAHLLQGATHVIDLATGIVLIATDSVSGVKSVFYTVDNDVAPALYVSSFTLPAGAHTLKYFAIDRLNNAEPFNSASIFVDTAPALPPWFGDKKPPVTTLTVLSSTGPLMLSAVDAGTNGGVASGVAQTFYLLSGTTYTLYTEPFAVATGTRTVRYYSIDVAGNKEPTRSAVVYLPDVTAPAPVTTLAAVALSSYSIQLSWTNTGDDDGVGLTRGLYRIDYSSDPGHLFALDTFRIQAVSTLQPGSTTKVKLSELALETTYYAAVYLADESGNWSQRSNVASTATLPVWFNDKTPPTTTLAVLSSTGPLALSATDAGTNGGAAIGLDQTFYSLNGATYTVYTAPFEVASGTRAVRYYSVDKAGNKERTQAVSVNLLDITPPAPITSLNAVVLSSQSVQLTWSHAGDDGISGNTRGAYRIDYSTDFTHAYSSAVFRLEAPLSLQPGRTAKVKVTGLDSVSLYTFAVFEADEAGNWSAASNVVSTGTLTPWFNDRRAPVTTLTVLSSTGPLMLSAIDTGSNGGEASGVVSTVYSVDDAAFAPYAGIFDLPSGKHKIQYFSRDLFGNVESTRTSNIALKDILPPDMVAVELMATSSTTVLISWTNTGDDGAAGFTTGYYRIDLTTDSGHAFSSRAYVKHQQFVLTPGATQAVELARLKDTTTYYAAVYLGDEIQNWSPASVIVSTRTLLPGNRDGDVFPPRTQLKYTGAFIDAFGFNLISPKTKLVLVSTETETAASGVRSISYKIDDSSWTVYKAPFYLAVGTRTLSYAAVDRAGNEEAVASIEFFVAPWAASGAYAAENATLAGGPFAVVGDVQAGGALEFLGTGKVTGDVTAPSIARPDTVTVTGAIAAVPPVASFLPVEKIYQDALASNDNASLPAVTDKGNALFTAPGKTLVLSNDKVTLSTGTYLFDSIHLSHNSQIKTNGPVRVVFTGSISMTDKVLVSYGNLPGQLALVGRGGGSVSLTPASGSRISWILHAPSKSFDVVGSPQIRGSVVAGRLSASGGFSISPDGTGLSGVVMSDLEGSGAAEGPDPAFVLGEVFAFPNPAKNGAVPVIHMETGLADRVTCQIYEITGRQVYELDASGVPPIVDSGQGAKFAYEFPWAGHVPSGVYYFIVTSEKSGEKPLKKAGKFSVVR